MHDTPPCPADAAGPGIAGPADTAPAKPWQLILADSELAAADLDTESQTLTLRLAAAHLRHPASGEAGHARGLALVLTQAQWQGQPQPGRLRDGRLWLGQGWQPGCAMPGHWQAPPGQWLQLEWDGAWGDRVQVRARAISVRLPDGALDWRPWLHC